MSIGVPKQKRVAPVSTISGDCAISATTTAAAVNDSDSNAISGCLVHGIAIKSASVIAADAQVSVMNGSTSVLDILLSDAANTLSQTVYAFPAPLAVSGALKLKHSENTGKVTYQVMYTPY